jgi:RNA polymerase sigma-70 factor (ECF subfamily)
VRVESVIDAVARCDLRLAAVSRARAMVDAHFERIWQSLRRLGLSDDDADDAVQQVFSIAARKMDVIEVGGELPYLLGIAVRVAAEAHRSRARRREVPEDDDRIACAPADSPLPDELLDQKRARVLLDEVLRSMPMDLRVVFVFFEIDGMSAPEIARVLGIPVGTVASRLRRAREHFHGRVERMARVGGRP